ncbi:hypothetical protein EOW65_14725 [Sinirhodobacter ferrireducens]|uniref:Uncharacterized protein n=1 Tax=Paenirhodobacter ferrireducens TaxID=1215032 RepID=A0A443LA76_9RHOB|nr:hypothetical protein EOW65_14725 [Sinirhodobacter ferrireducens]
MRFAQPRGVFAPVAASAPASACRASVACAGSGAAGSAADRLRDTALAPDRRRASQRGARADRRTGGCGDRRGGDGRRPLRPPSLSVRSRATARQRRCAPHRPDPAAASARRRRRSSRACR